MQMWELHNKCPAAFQQTAVCPNGVGEDMPITGTVCRAELSLIVLCKQKHTAKGTQAKFNFGFP